MVEEGLNQLPYTECTVTTPTGTLLIVTCFDLLSAGFLDVKSNTFCQCWSNAGRVQMLYSVNYSAGDIDSGICFEEVTMPSSFKICVDEVPKCLISGRMNDLTVLHSEADGVALLILNIFFSMSSRAQV